MNNKKNLFLIHETPKKIWSKVQKQGLQVLFHIVMEKFPIPENCSAYVPMILKELCSSKINSGSKGHNSHKIQEIKISW